MDCVFCKIIDGEIPAKKVYEDDFCVAILDLGTTTNGHTLIIPKKHYANFTELDNDALTKLQERAQKVSDTLMNKLDVTGTSLLFNYGTSISVPHFHLHLLPDFKYGQIKGDKTIDEVFEIISK